MKAAEIVALLWFIVTNSIAQKFDTDTIVYNGNSDQHINLVILGDGYTINELSKFEADATNFTTGYFKEIPYSNYKNYFNVFIIKVPSNESGASHPGTATDVQEPVIPVIMVDNYFGSTFDYAGIHRLLVATKTTVISNVLASNFPDYDMVMIIVNSNHYGGSGGMYPVASMHSASVKISAHELGHSFAGLRDEYWAGDQYAGEAINMTQQTDLLRVRWGNWVGANSIGIFQHCCGGNSRLWYKPHQYCLMQNVEAHFCSVCVEGIVERIHSLVSPIKSSNPPDGIINDTIYPLKFKLDLITPSPNTLKRIWTLNGALLKENVDSVLIEKNDLLPGNSLSVSIEDTTQLLRVDNHIHIYYVRWSIGNSTTGVNTIAGSSSEISVFLYPNPTSGYLNIKSEGATGNIGFEIYDIQGRKVLSLGNVNSINLQNLSPGTYFIRIYIDNDLVSTRKIIRE